LFRFISLLLRNFHFSQLFSARGAILLIIELAPSMEEEEEKKIYCVIFCHLERKPRAPENWHTGVLLNEPFYGE